MSILEARERHQQDGFTQACLEALKAACVDRRFQRAHRLILVCIIENASFETCTSWPSRELMAAETGLSVQTVSNRINEMRSWGYLLWESVLIEEAYPKKLRHYTLVITEELRAKRLQLITEYCDALKAGKLPAGGYLTDGPVSKVTGGPVRVPKVTGGQVSPVTGGQVTFEGVTGGRVTKTPKVTGGPVTVSISEEREVEAIASCNEVDLLGEPLSTSAVKRTKGYVAVKLPSETRATPISLQWLQGQRRGVADELLLEFAEVEARRFVDENPKTRNGRPMSLFGFMGSAFQYRFDQWLASRTGATPRRNDDPYKPVKTQSGGWTRQGLLMRPEDMPGLENVKPLARID